MTFKQLRRAEKESRREKILKRWRSLRRAFPHLNPTNLIAKEMGISVVLVYQILEGRR